MNQFIKGIPLNITWHFRKPDGSPYSITGYRFVLKYRNARETATINTLVVNLEQGTISFVLTPAMQSSLGLYSFQLELWHAGLHNIINYSEAFLLVAQANGMYDESMCQGETPPMQSCNIFSVGTFDLYQPTAPVPGSDGYWYFNGERIVDEQGNYIPINYTLTYISEGVNKGRLIMNEGRDNEQIIDAVKDALAGIEEALARATDDEIEAAWNSNI